jgi:hypothetical protein
MRDAVDIIGLEVIYKGHTVKIDSIQLVPKSGNVYITLKQDDSTYINVPYKEVYRIIKQQTIRL